MKVYLNFRGPYGVETVDEFVNDGNCAPANPREFRAYVKKVVGEYHLAGIPIYRSQRPCKEWADRE